MSEEWLIKGAAIVGGEPADIHLKDGVIAGIGRDDVMAPASVPVLTGCATKVPGCVKKAECP